MRYWIDITLHVCLQVKSRGAILRVTSSKTCSSFALAKFEYSSLIGQCWSLRWSRDTFFFYKITTLPEIQSLSRLKLPCRTSTTTTFSPQFPFFCTKCKRKKRKKCNKIGKLHPQKVITKTSNSSSSRKPD